MSTSEGKPFYKIGEVCELTATQPYVLRFWESEFPALAPRKNRSGQRIYRKRDIDLIQRIKALLYEQEYTIAGARKVLEAELNESDDVGDGDSSSHAAAAQRVRSASAKGVAETEDGDDGAKPRADLGGAVSDASGRSGEQRGLPLRSSDHQLEVEVKNLRAKLAHVEGELRALLEDMDRRDKRQPAVTREKEEDNDARRP